MYEASKGNVGHPDNVDIFMDENIDKKMNMYEKIQIIKVQMDKLDLKKSGYNKFSNYPYFELRDFSPQLNQLIYDFKLMSYFTFSKEYASLIVVNCENPIERLELTSPMVGAVLKGMHEIQNLGAVMTYQRRYLYIVLFDLSENDFFELVANNQTKQEKKVIQEPKKVVNNYDVDDEEMFELDENEVISQLEAKALFRLCYVDNVPNWKPLNELTKKYGYNKATEIKVKDYHKIMNELKKAMNSN
jgi:hypothetical protein